jgi:hypothetical protein
MQSGNSGQHSVGLIPSLKLETMIDREGYRRTTQTNPTKLQHYYQFPAQNTLVPKKWHITSPFLFLFFYAMKQKIYYIQQKAEAKG